MMMMPVFVFVSVLVFLFLQPNNECIKVCQMYVGEGTARVYAFLMCVNVYTRIVIRVKFEVRQVNAYVNVAEG